MSTPARRGATSSSWVPVERACRPRSPPPTGAWTPCWSRRAPTSAGRPPAPAAGSGSPATTRCARPARSTPTTWPSPSATSRRSSATSSPRERRDTFIDRGPEVMDFLRDHTPVRFAWVPEYADYLPERPGGRVRGRSVEPVPMDARFLGDELDPPAPAVHQGAGQPDRHPGRLPQDQPGHAHDPRPAHDGPGHPQPDREQPARPQDVRDGQRAGHRPAPGARRGRASRSTTTPSCATCSSRTAGSSA